MIFISGGVKFEYIIGEISAPAKNDPGFKAWNIDNMMVMSWLLNTMEAHISHNFPFHKTTKSLWEAVAKRYSDHDNSSEIFEVKTKLRNLRQGNNDVGLYFNQLDKYWQELDAFDDLEWHCTEDSIKYAKKVEKERTYEFLAGLNDEYDDVHSRIIGMKPLPSTDGAFAEVRKEQSWRKVMLKRVLSHLIELEWRSQH